MHDLGEAMRCAQVSVTAKSDTADGLELDALDKARAFFGPDARLEIIPGWSATPGGRDAPGQYISSVTVRRLAP